nr:PREDICTED: transport and Golgi organization protein 11 isoform X2 [Tribolium castaneum]|eukprot:XP_015835755.1 PREDICTED: transport and Golgi organization protein 11 isoform X2 [Tribolium castaneum]
MSASTSPSHYTEDAFVTDANFKVEINQKMKVPDKISFNTDLNGATQPPWNRDNINMQVPERILVVGQHQHIEPYPGDVRVATPPRTLTLDKYPFPTLEEMEDPELNQIPVVKPKKKQAFDDSDLNLTIRETTPPIGGSGERLTAAEEVLHLRRQMAKLNRRVMALELENLSRLQKEKFLVGFGVAYLLLKVIIWMNRD